MRYFWSPAAPIWMASWISRRSPSQAIVLRRFFAAWRLDRRRAPPAAEWRWWASWWYSTCINERRNCDIRSNPRPVTSSRITCAANTCAATRAFSSGDGNLQPTSFHSVSSFIRPNWGNRCATPAPSFGQFLKKKLPTPSVGLKILICFNLILIYYK